MRTRYVAILLGAVNIDVEKLKGYPGVAVYRIDGPETEHKIEMALLNNLVVPLKFIFVGAGAKHFARSISRHLDRGRSNCCGRHSTVLESFRSS